MATKILDILINAKDAASPAFTTVSGKLTLLRARANEAASGLTDVRKFLSGGALLGMFVGVARGIEEAANAMGRLRAGLADGSTTLRDWAADTARSFPILGHATKAFDAVRNAITGEREELRRLNAETERRVALMGKLDEALSRRPRTPEQEIQERRRTVASDLPQARTAEERVTREAIIRERQRRIDDDAAALRQKRDEDRAASEQAAADAHLSGLKERAAAADTVSDAIRAIQRDEAQAAIEAASGLQRELLRIEQERIDRMREIEQRYSGELLTVLRERALAAAQSAIDARRAAAIRAAEAEAADKAAAEQKDRQREEVAGLREQRQAATRGDAPSPTTVASEAITDLFRGLAANSTDDTARKSLEEARRARVAIESIDARLRQLEVATL